MLTRFVRIQLAIFTVASIVGIAAMLLVYMQVPTLLGIGRITVTLELPRTGGLYEFSNVTYRGVQIGKVTDVRAVRGGGAGRIGGREVCKDDEAPAPAGPVMPLREKRFRRIIQKTQRFSNFVITGPGASRAQGQGQEDRRSTGRARPFAGTRVRPVGGNADEGGNFNRPPYRAIPFRRLTSRGAAPSGDASFTLRFKCIILPHTANPAQHIFVTCKETPMAPATDMTKLKKNLYGEMRRLANDQFDSPQYQRLLNLPLNVERARLYVLQKGFWNLNRRDCWAFAQGLAPMDVKALIWEHELDELQGNDKRGVEDHYSLQVRQAATIGLTRADFENEVMRDETRGIIYAYIHLAKDTHWLYSVATCAALEVSNSSDWVAKGGMS